jgi:hypothetical protein
MMTADELIDWILDLFQNAFIDKKAGELVIWTGVRSKKNGRLSVIGEDGVDLDFSINDLFAWVNNQLPGAIVRTEPDGELVILTGLQSDQDDVIADLERSLGAPIDMIARSILHGFRARVDVAGRLAEAYFERILARLVEDGVLKTYRWLDQDDRPDFEITTSDGRTFTIEVKMIRRDGPWRVETQRARSSKTNPLGRFYRVDRFDILAICLQSRTGRWDYRFVWSSELARHHLDANLLAPIQYIDPASTCSSLEELIY